MTCTGPSMPAMMSSARSKHISQAFKTTLLPFLPTLNSSKPARPHSIGDWIIGKR